MPGHRAPGDGGRPGVWWFLSGRAAPVAVEGRRACGRLKPALSATPPSRAEVTQAGAEPFPPCRNGHWLGTRIARAPAGQPPIAQAPDQTKDILRRKAGPCLAARVIRRRGISVAPRPKGRCQGFQTCPVAGPCSQVLNDAPLRAPPASRAGMAGPAGLGTAVPREAAVARGRGKAGHDPPDGRAGGTRCCGTGSGGTQLTRGEYDGSGH